MTHSRLHRSLVLCLFAIGTALAAQTSASPAQAPQTTAPQTPDATAPPLTAAPSPGTPQTTTPPQSSANQPTRNPDGTYTVRTTSRIVILDVVVLDKKGNIVPNLQRSDFHITDSGQPEKITNFEAAGAHTPDPDTTINSTADLDRLAPRAPVNIILLDEFNTRFEDMAFARYSLKKYLDKQPGKLTMPTMLIAVSLQNFTVLQDYTQDKSLILQSLDHHFVAYPWQMMNGGWLSERYSQAFVTLLRVAAATEGHQGHKNMIWIGRGFPNLNLANIPVDGRQRIENVVQEAVNKLRDARVTLYTIDPAGVQSDPSAYGTDAGLFDPFGGEYTFNRLARATGGRTFYGRNDVDAEIGTSLRDGAAFYTLVYRPESGAALDRNKFRKIDVTFDDPGYKAVTRQGYYPQRGPGRVDPAHPSRRLTLELASANNSNMVYDGVPLTLTPDPAIPDKFTVHVDGKGLVWAPATDTGPRHADVILLATSFDKKGKELQHIAQAISVKAPLTVAPTGRLDRSIDFRITVPHDNNAVRARFTVRVTATGKIGTADGTLGQPPQQAATPAPAPQTP